MIDGLIDVGKKCSQRMYLCAPSLRLSVTMLSQHSEGVPHNSGLRSRIYSNITGFQSGRRNHNTESGFHHTKYD